MRINQEHFTFRVSRFAFRVPRHQFLFVLVMLVAGGSLSAQTSPLWREQKVKNYLPHMTWPEVEDLLSRNDMVIIPVPSLEQHARHLPVGTDFLLGMERAKLIAQRTEVLVAPIMLIGSAPYHMGFPGSITLPFDTIQRVYFEAAQSLIRHGFKRILIMNSHNGNMNISRYVVDRINQETEAAAVELGEAAAPFVVRSTRPPTRVLDGHAGVGETSAALYLFPPLVDMEKATTATLTLPEHVEKLVPQVLAGDPTAQRLYSTETMKPRETGKRTSAREISSTGGSGARDPRESTVEQGREETEAFVNAAVQFIERWKQLRPLKR